MSGGQHDVERYREAAYAALDQLDWAIKFFYRIQKSEIADVLEKNRRTIIARHGLRTATGGAGRRRGRTAPPHPPPVGRARRRKFSRRRGNPAKSPSAGGELPRQPPAGEQERAAAPGAPPSVVAQQREFVAQRGASQSTLYE